MADETQTENVAEVPPPKKKKLLLAGIAALVLAAAGGGGWWMFIHHGGSKKTDSAKTQQAQAEPFLVDIPTIVSNLDTNGARPIFVKINAKLQVRNGTREQVLAQMPEIQNVFQTYLHESRQAELSGNGIYRVREAILDRIAIAIAPIEARDLFFVEFLVQ